MDITQLVTIGAKAFMNSKGSGANGSNLDISSLTSALSGLTGGGSSGGLDIASLLGGMQGSGLSGILNSWLGDGENENISANQVTNLLGSDKVSAFAEQLGLSKEEAIGGLQDAMPQMVDKASSGGSLIDSLGGVSGMMNMANSFFGK